MTTHPAFAVAPAEPRLGVYNFSAGPSHMPIEVVDQLREELADLSESGIGLLEHSHRGRTYMDANAEAEAVIRRLTGVGDDFAVIFMPGGATVNFGFLALNFLQDGGTGVYLDTSIWARKAIDEAMPIGKVHIGFDGRSGGAFTCPDPAKGGADIDAPADAKYLFYCANNTGEGTWYGAPPTTDLPMIGDLTSDIFSRPWPFEKHAMTIAAGQKNLGAAGCSIVVARRDFIESASTRLGPILRFADHEKAQSILNTPPTFAVRVIGLMAEWTEAQGGPAAIATRNAEKAGLVWNEIDSSGGFYRSPADVRFRSNLNVTFNTGDAALDARFLAEARTHGMENLGGLPGVGGMRASMYNAFPVRGAEILVDFMRDFAARNG
jgi:phosphoserine aminotransferase